jgi:hypothetical protein
MATRWRMPPDKLAGKRVLETLQADKLDHVLDVVASLRDRAAQHLQRYLDVAPDAAPRQEGRVLEGDAGLAGLRGAHRGLAGDPDLPGIGRFKPERDAHHRGFAAARRTDDRGERPFRAGQGDVAQRLDHLAPPREGLSNPGKRDSIRGHAQISSRSVVSNISRVPLMPTSASARRFASIPSSVMPM